MRRRDGIAHSSDLRASGFADRAVAEAVRRGELRRVRRSWLATEECDPRHVAAASVGGRVTCLSAAALRGLWTPEHAEVHVAVAGNASRFAAVGVLVHWAAGPAPTSRAMVEDPLLNVLFHVARCASRADALAVWESALRLRLTDVEVLRAVAWRSVRARDLAAVASDLSDSGVETRFLDLMRGIGVAVRQQVWIDGHPVDALIGERLVVQLDGFAHHQGRDRRRDLRADARLAVRGFTVLRFDYQQVLFDPEHVLDTVRVAMAQRLHRIR